MKSAGFLPAQDVFLKVAGKSMLLEEAKDALKLLGLLRSSKERVRKIEPGPKCLQAAMQSLLNFAD